MPDDNPYRSPVVQVTRPSRRKRSRIRPWLALNVAAVGGVFMIGIGGGILTDPDLDPPKLLLALTGWAISGLGIYYGVCQRKQMRLQAIQAERRRKLTYIEAVLNVAFCGRWPRRRNHTRMG
jgi:hypothetical protein